VGCRMMPLVVLAGLRSTRASLEESVVLGALCTLKGGSGLGRVPPDSGKVVLVLDE